MDTKEIIDKKLVYWRKKLIDLSKRNNLVSYRFTKSKSIKIIFPGIEQIVKDLDHEENIRILKKSSENAKERVWSPSEDEETIEKKLYALYLKAKDNFQELGLNTCFVSIGMLKYKDSENSDIFLQAPVLLYQVEINRLHTTSKDTHNFEIDSNSGDLQFIAKDLCI